jgi:hypothetical protein
MRLPNTPLIMRIDVAKTLCQYQLKKPPRAIAPLTPAPRDTMPKPVFVLNNPLDVEAVKPERRQRNAAGQKEIAATTERRWTERNRGDQGRTTSRELIRASACDAFDRHG